MQRRGYSLQYAERIYQQICGFGEYGFPESHSASFAVLAYVSAYLKYYYPAAFCTALLNSYPMGFYTPSQLLQDARRHGVTVLEPCINASLWDYSLAQQGQAIRVGLRQIKGLSQSGVERLVELRPVAGYRHVQQLQQLGLSRADLQALASAGALSSISGDRYNSRWQLLDTQHSLPLFADAEPLPDKAILAELEPTRCSGIAEQATAYLAAPDETATMLEDYAALGFSLTQHPLALLRRLGKLPRSVPAAELHRIRHQSPVRISGLVTLRQRPGTAAGVTFVSLEDETGTCNVLVWLATARAQQQNFLTARILQVDGIVQREAEVVHIIAGKLVDLSALLTDLKLSSRDFH